MTPSSFDGNKTKQKLYSSRCQKYQQSRLSKSGKSPNEEKKEFVPTSFWTKTNEFGMNLNEVAFVNWNAGGEKFGLSIANLNLTRNYKFRHVTWNNEFRARYGINAQEGRKMRKTDDFMKFSSAFGYRTDTITPWYYSAKFKFNSQFANGFKYPDRSRAISKFMAPGYSFLGVGVTYQPELIETVLYISPITKKATFVLDDALSAANSFGVRDGRSTFIEFGMLITHTWEREVLKNVKVNNRVNLYTDYIRSFGNVDIDWELNIGLKVNEHLRTEIGTHLIYDDDILFDPEVDNDGNQISNGVQTVKFSVLKTVE